MLCFPQSARGAICFGFLASELADKPYIDYNIRSSSLSACQQARTTIFQGMCENPRFSVWCHKAPQLISHIGKLTSHRLYIRKTPCRRIIKIHKIPSHTEYFSKNLLTDSDISAIILPTNAIEQKQVGMGSARRELPFGARQMRRAY